MYEKVKNTYLKFFDDHFKIGLIFWVILFVLSIISFSIEQKWPEVFTYPEDAYQTLETEATKMAETHNLETDYVCTYEYNNETRCLSLNLTDGTCSIYATISNYGSDNQDISTKRSIESKIGFIEIKLILYFVLLPLLGTLLIMLMFIALMSLVFFVAFISHKIREKISKSKE